MKRGIRRLVAAVAGVSSLVRAEAALAADAATDDAADNTAGQDRTSDRLDPRDIVVFGRHPDGSFDGVAPEDELDRNGIDSYGADSIGQLITQLSDDLSNGDDGIVVLINGQRASGINDISDLPVEAANKVQLLPKALAARLGQPPGQRVLNIVIRPNYSQVTPRTRASLSTRGDALQLEAELNLLKLRNGSRRSLVLLAMRNAMLRESQRDITPDPGAVPYDPLGNVVAAAGAGAEIDLALSALAGSLVTVAAVPRAIAQPSLANFVIGAGHPNATIDGGYRSLLPESRTYAANASVSERISPRTTWFFNTKVDFGQTTTLRGQTTGLLLVPAGATGSPFSRPTSLAYVLGDALRSRQDYFAINLAEILNRQVGKFNLSLQTTFNHRVQTVLSDRPVDLAPLQAGIVAGLINPFTQVGQQTIGPAQVDRSRSRTDSTQMQLSLGGPLLTLPAGPLLLSSSLFGRFDRSESRYSGSFTGSRRYRRDEYGARGNMTVPLIGGDRDSLRLTADLGGALHKQSGAPLLHDLSAMISADFGKHLTFSGAYQRDQIAPPVSALNDSPVITENFRTFDFVRGETVLVRSIAGGNPLLPIQRKRTVTAQVAWRPLATNDLQISAEFSRVRNRDVYAALPPVSAEVQLAFPDRYVRDLTGRLIQIDARPVAFLRDEVEKLRWGVKWRHTYGGDVVGGDESDSSSRTLGQGVRINFDLSHDLVLRSNRQARTGLPVVDLLRGGAIGYGGGTIRNVITANLGLSGHGMGLQLDGQWHGKSYVTTGTAASPNRLQFDDRAIVGVRFFANLGPLLPDRDWARGMRVTVQVNNLFDSRQRVTDLGGVTPQRYQPFLLDPLGRSISLGLRKAF